MLTYLRVRIQPNSIGFLRPNTIEFRPLNSPLKVNESILYRQFDDEFYQNNNTRFFSERPRQT